MLRIPLPLPFRRLWPDFVPAVTPGDQAIGDALPIPHFREATGTDEAAWDALVGSQPSGDFLQSWAWGAVADFDAEPVRRFVLEEDGEIVAVAAVQARVTRGILNSSLVHPREVFCAAIVASAAAVILCHNHPSGDPTPSADDRIVTEQMVAAGRLLDIPVHDHIIIGRGRYTSFAEAGLL